MPPMPAASYIDPRNGKLYPLDQPRWCSDERTPLLVTPGAGMSREEVEPRTRSLWRYRAALPVEIKNPITLGEGCTPLVQQAWGDLRPLFKLEWFNPTGSFKDRGSSVMLSFLRQIGVDAILEDSSGNGGSSMAGLGAAGGMRVKILAPASTSPAKIAQVRAYGAAVQLVEGPREESEAEAIRQSQQTFYASHNWQPFFLEGTKSLAYEIWEDLGFRAPDNVIVPVGAGSSLLGCAFGFRELLKAGQIAKLPRLFAAQPLNCSPIDASFQAGVDTPVAREVNKTIAEGTAIKNPLRLREIIGALRESGGGAVAVTDGLLAAAASDLQTLEGIDASPEGGASLAGAIELKARGAFRPDDRVVIFNTGAGWLYRA